MCSFSQEKAWISPFQGPLKWIFLCKTTQILVARYYRCCFLPLASFFANIKTKLLPSLLQSWLLVIDWGHLILLFRGRQQLRIAVVLVPSCVWKWLFYILYYKQTSFKGSFVYNQWWNAKKVEVLQNIWNNVFWVRISENLSELWRLYVLFRRWEINQNMEISQSDG